MELLKYTLPTGAKVEVWLHGSTSEMDVPLCAARPVMVVCPGGGYVAVSNREKDPVAREFFRMGFQVLTLTYSIGDAAGGKRPLEELARTVLLARQNAESWQLDPNKLAVIGFSAGGHLAASLGVHWDDPEIARRLGLEDSRILRPDVQVLCYPVITANPELSHRGSIDHVSAGTHEAPDYWSLETQINDQTPPAFLWHTMEDAGVPAENSLMYAAALHRAGVACEAHFYPQGPHGCSTCTKEVSTDYPSLRSWVGLCRTWLDTVLGPLPG